MFRRADKIRERLGWVAGIAHPNGDKPKGMHWRTFSQLTYEHDALKIRLIGGMAKQLGLEDQI